MIEYPEHEKLISIHPESQAIGEFIDWLAAEKQTRLHYSGQYGCEMVHSEPLLAEFFGVSLTRLEAEKQDMLSRLRGGG